MSAAARIVSTHSRPKAAGFLTDTSFSARRGFNTQPPEGGWMPMKSLLCRCRRFNTQPPEGGWFRRPNQLNKEQEVSTHSRPKAAGKKSKPCAICMPQFQHTAARRRLAGIF